MAARKTTKRRKPGAKKRKSRIGAMPSAVNISGHNYKRDTCHSTKSDAKQAVERLHQRGFRATALKRGTRWCTFKGGVSKFWKRRKAA